MNRSRNPIATTRIITMISAMCFVALSGLTKSASADEQLFYPTEPPLADSGWTVRYNGLLVACYQGAMDACDQVVSDRGMISGNAVYDYAATCGGRLDVVTARRMSAQMFQNGIPGGKCSYVFG
jgi:hypothetical protein